jgi:CBS-domain-containing membrane protein
MNHMVSDVMAAPVISVQPATSFKRMVELLDQHQICALPVVDADGCVLGIVSDTDLALKEEHQPSGQIPFFADAARRAQHAKAQGTTAADLMSSPVATLLPGASLEVAARLLRQRRVRHLPVVDAAGRLVGMVTRRDLLKVFLHPDAELRYEITVGVLHATFNLPDHAVQVQARDGVVTLTGEVPWRSSAREIVDRVRALDGVVDVVDRLSWTHDDTVTATATPWIYR